MIRKLFVKLFIISLFVFILSTNVYAKESSVNITLPTFPVTINGLEIDNNYNEYPLIIYKDITYFPMTYHGSRFLHLKANWYTNGISQGVIFVGYNNEVEDTLEVIKTNKKNKLNYVATIAEYNIAINTLQENKFLDNSIEPYPILNFREITYFPLTWKFAVEEFGWEYSFTKDKGLVINSAEQFKPVLDDESFLGATLPSRYLGLKNYVYNDTKTEYVGYPNTNLAGSEFVYCEKGNEEKILNLNQEFSDGEYYFNVQSDIKESNILLPDKEVNLTDGLLTIKCSRKNNTGVSNFLLKIDIRQGTIISKEELKIHK